MKRVLSFLLSAVLLASLTICGTALAQADEYVYGTASLTWEQFWAGEDITYSDEHDLGALNETTDTEGMTDLGGFDAVTRATAKHGLYRGSVYFDMLINAADEAGSTVSIKLSEIADIENLEDMYGAGKQFYAVGEGDEAVYTLLEPTEGTYSVYTISDYEILGYKAWPVKVPASQAEAAAEAIGFVADESVTEDTGRLKTVSVDENGNVTVSAMAPASGKAVSYEGTPSLSYGDRYGDYLFIALKDCDEDWSSNLVGIIYEFFGDTNPEDGGEALATYGTKYAADFWRKGTQLQLGINQSYRHGGSGEAVGTEQNGYWRVTIMSVGYEDYSFVIESKPAYEGDIAAALGEDNATLTISGVAEDDWKKTTVSVDGTEVTGFENGVKTLDAALSVGDHSVTVTVEAFRDNELTVTGMSAMTAEDIALEDNVLTIADGDIATYLANISGIAVNSTTLSGKELGKTVFNEDGSVNFEAVISGRGGDTVVFENGDQESYELMITSAGYPIVVLNTTAAK